MIQSSAKTSDLIRNRQSDRAWQRHCGFLDLTLSEVMEMQRRLLEEQFTIARSSRLWQTLFPDLVDDLCPDTFRDLAPLTDYAVYAPLLCDQRDDILAAPVAAWMRTSGRGGTAKWVPYTEQELLHAAECSVGTALLATARYKGDIGLKPHDVIVTNLPPRPYLSGWMHVTADRLFDFHYIPPLDEGEQLSFQERSAKIFQQAMVEGMDLLGAMTIVLVRMGEMFASGANARQGRLSLEMLQPRVLWRYGRAWLRARRERRHVLPRDLWSLKCLQCGGTDTAFYREQIKEYWGVYPHETYGCTEVGLLATQAWDYGDMTFIPSTAFLEFIPIEEWEAERLRGTPPMNTVLLDEVEVGKRYEVVISSLRGGPFLRYRMHDLIEITALENGELGIRQPQFRFVGRSGDFIDLSGFAGLIDERSLLGALAAAGIAFSDWVICKEGVEGKTSLCMYLEPKDCTGPGADHIRARLHEQLKTLNPDYASMESMLGFVPLRVQLLTKGTFDRYLAYQNAQGADLAHLKPLRIQPPDQALQLLLALSEGSDEVQA